MAAYGAEWGKSRMAISSFADHRRSQGMPAAPLGLPTTEMLSSEEVMTRVKEGPGTPLFICHGDFTSGGFYAFRLIELLRHDGPVYLLHSILDEAKGIVTVEEMVPARRAAARGPPAGEPGAQR